MNSIILIVIFSMFSTNIDGRDFKSFEEFISVFKNGTKSTSSSSKSKIALPSEENGYSFTWKFLPFFGFTLFMFIIRLLCKLAKNNWKLKSSWFYVKSPSIYQQRNAEKQERELAMSHLVSWVAALQDGTMDVDESYEHMYTESNV